MGNFSHYPLQKAVFQKLTSDSILINLVTATFDRPPQTQLFPYITLGESIVKDWSTKTTNGCEQQFIIRVWSREGGLKQAEVIMDRIHTVLHDASLAVDGQFHVLTRFISSGVDLESDGWTYQGTMRFKSLLQAV